MSTAMKNKTCVCGHGAWVYTAFCLCSCHGCHGYMIDSFTCVPGIPCCPGGPGSPCGPWKMIEAVKTRQQTLVPVQSSVPNDTHQSVTCLQYAVPTKLQLHQHEYLSDCLLTNQCCEPTVFYLQCCVVTLDCGLLLQCKIEVLIWSPWFLTLENMKK